MKGIKIAVLLLLVSVATGQYGIPDDDDTPTIDSQFGLRGGAELLTTTDDFTGFARVGKSVRFVQDSMPEDTVMFAASKPAMTRVSALTRSAKISDVIHPSPIPIVKFLLANDHYGNYNVESLSGDGSAQASQGELKDLGDPNGPSVVMSGSYSYLGDDGKTYAVDWIADETGFHAAGDHLPTAH